MTLQTRLRRAGYTDRRDHPVVPRDLADIVERTAALPRALRDRVVRAWSHALVAAEGEIDDAGRPGARGIGRKLVDDPERAA